MSLLHASDLATVYQADARDVLQDLATESVDLVVTDPPYGQEWQSGRRAETFDLMHGDDRTRLGVADVLAQCVRVVGQHRHLYVFGPPDVLDGLKITDTATLIWDKGRPGLGNLSAPWGPAHEPITFAVSVHRHAGKRGSDSLAVRMRKGSVLNFAAPTGRNVRHPSEKPVPLLRELIESSSRLGDLVLDPFGGSGSTAVAAILSGRRAITIESNPAYAELIVSRVAAAEKLALASRTT